MHLQHYVCNVDGTMGFESCAIVNAHVIDKILSMSLAKGTRYHVRYSSSGNANYEHMIFKLNISPVNNFALAICIPFMCIIKCINTINFSHGFHRHETIVARVVLEKP